MTRHALGLCMGLTVTLVIGHPALASFHLMQIEQVIAGVDGDLTAQAIQLRQRTAGQNFVSQARLRVLDANGLNAVTILDMATDNCISNNNMLCDGTGGRRILLATNNFLTQTTPTTVPDFIMANPIPPAYLAAGTLIFESNSGGFVYWRVSWGGASYTGSGSVITVASGGNDDDGTANPAFGGPLPSASTQALQFTGSFGDPSTTNQAQYAVTAASAGFVNNANGAFTVTGTVPTGACCEEAAGECTEEVTEAACSAPGQRYGGDDSTCANMEPPCPSLSLSIVLEVVAGSGQSAGPGTLSSPLGLTDAGDGTGRLFIVDQPGQIRVIDADGTLLAAPYLDVSSKLPPLGIDFGGGFIFDERGLLGVAFHPDFETNGRFYVRYSKPRTSTGSEPCDLDVPPGVCHEEVLAEYTVEGDPLTTNEADTDLSIERILFRWDKPQWNHNAGHIEFGPDGMLYVSTGDGGGANDGLCDSPPSHGPGGNGQNIESKLGKMIRIDVDGSDGPGGLYGIPADNPFVGVAGLDEIFAYGFRNPYRFSFDDSGGRLFVADVGQDIYEEIDLVELGGNYGWAVREGAHCFVPPCPPLPGCGNAGFTDPISEYTHAEGGTAVVGGYVYHGSAFPQLQGHYVYGDFSADFGPTGRLYYLDLSPEVAGPGQFPRREFFVQPNGNPIGKFVKGFGEDEDGELYVCASGTLGPSGTDGVIYKIVPPPPPTATWNCPDGNISNSTCVARTRALTFTVDSPAVATGGAGTAAIKVTMLDLQTPAPPNNACCPPPDFSTYESATCTAAGEMNSCARWVGPPYTYSEAAELPNYGNYRASRLQCTPYYHYWENEPLGGAVNVIGAEILPSSTYALKLYSSSCKGIEDTCPNTSSDTLIKTRRAGDIASIFQTTAPPLTQPNVIDVVGTVNHFKKAIGAPKHIEVQVQPNLPNPNRDVDALDIQSVIYNVHLRAYPFSGPCSCPSTVPCDTTVCANDPACTGTYGAGSLCVRTCAMGSPRAGEACTLNKHCGVCVGGSRPGIPCDANSQCDTPSGGTCSLGTCAAGGFCRDRCGRCN